MEMEMSLTQIAIRPLCLVNKQFMFPNKRREKTICVNALKSSYSKTATLSSNWDVSDLYAVSPASAPAWFPRFEELDITNTLLRRRIIFLGSQLLLLDAEDSKKDINFFINSPGGSVTAGMGIYDAMKMCKADVSTICLGLAASMGAFLLATGTKGKGFCMPNSRVMIHQPLRIAGGKATEMSIRIREVVYHKVKLNKILSRATGKPEEQIEIDTDRDNFMNPWEAKEYGLVDGVIDEGKSGLVAPISDSTPPPGCGICGKSKGARKPRRICLQNIKCYRMDIKEVKEVMREETQSRKRENLLLYEI
ncbi:hypothetical protein REPUB_Repub12eG0022500 [Reevesia pubescens]